MSLYEDVRAALKAAMLARDTVGKDSISALRGELLLLEKDNKHGEITDQDVIGICKKMIKQRQDAIVHFRKGDRQDLVDQDEAQIEVLKQFLPEALGEAELAEIISGVCAEIKPEGMKDMGRIMGAVKGKVTATGKDVDGKMLADLVKASLQG